MKSSFVHEVLHPGPFEAAASGDSEVKAPGSRAPTVRVKGLVNSLPRWILSCEGSLRGFLRTIISLPQESKSPTSRLSRAEAYGRSLWPIPVPFPEVFREGGCGDEGWQKKLLSLEVVVLSWLNLGCPDVAPAFLRLGSRLTAKQWDVVHYLRRLSFDDNLPEFVDSALMGRAASKFENIDDLLAALSRSVVSLHAMGNGYFGKPKDRPLEFDDSWMASGAMLYRVKDENLMAAKPIRSQRLAFPGEPKFDPVPFFDAATSEIYCHPIRNATDHSEFAGQIPKVRINAKETEKILLFKKLADSRRLAAVCSSKMRGPFQSGLFAVAKNAEKDRLILDARPPNLLEVARTRWCSSMASGACMADLFIPEDCNLLSSGLDLTDYFYQFVITEERKARNILASAISLEEAKEVFGPGFEWHEDPVRVALSTMAMGDLSAVEFAQSSHLGLLTQRGITSNANLLSYKRAVPRGPLLLGVIIDDFIAMEKVLKTFQEEDLGELHSAKVVEDVLEAYSSVNLSHNPKKSFKAAKTARFWGIELDGVNGLVRSSSYRIWPLIFVTMRICLLKTATFKLLEVLAGCWISVLLCRRRMLCLMSIVFEPLGICNAQGNHVIRLSEELVDELMALAVLAPLATADLRADYLPFIGATDASSRWMASVQAEVSPEIVAEMCRHSLKKSNWSQLLPPHKAWLREKDLLCPEDELPEEVFDTHPLWTCLAESLDYVENWRRPSRPGQHINISELKAYLLEEKELAVRYKRKRFLCGLDSQVALGGLIKGRTSSKSLNKLLRGALCYPLGSGIFSYLMYYASATNRADGPTRDSAPQPASRKPPSWFHEIPKGDFRAFDCWMIHEERGVVTKPFDLDDLNNGSQLDIQPGSAVRKKRKQQASKKMTSESVVQKEKCEAAVLGESVVDPPNTSASTTRETVPSGETPESDETPQHSCYELLTSIPSGRFLSKTNLDLKKAGAVDLYSGSFGVARALLDLGAPWVLCFEWKRSSEENLLLASNQNLVRELLIGGAILSLSMAPICASFSMSVTPAVRDHRFPRGKPNLSANMRVKVADGNRHHDFTTELAETSQIWTWGFFWKTLTLLGFGVRRRQPSTASPTATRPFAFHSAGLELHGRRIRGLLLIQGLLGFE